MGLFEGLTMRESLKKAQEMREKLKPRIETRRRELALMEAGLFTRPFDKDFFELCKLKFEQQCRPYELGNTLVQILEERMAADPNDPCWEKIMSADIYMGES